MVKLILEMRRFPFAFANYTIACGRGISAQSGTFYPQFTGLKRRRHLRCSRFSTLGSIGAVMLWLLSDCSVFGLTMQNWMWALPGVLLLYAAIVIYVRSRHADLRL